MQLDLRHHVRYFDDGPVMPKLNHPDKIMGYSQIFNIEMMFSSWFYRHIQSRIEGITGLAHAYLRRKSDGIH
jgi:hypothetical protein